MRLRLSMRSGDLRVAKRRSSLTSVWSGKDGRLFRNKADQDERLSIVKRGEDEDYDEEFDEAKNRIFWAELRRDERQALADARQRARDIKQEQERRQRKAKRVRARKGGKQKTSTGKRRWDDSELI